MQLETTPYVHTSDSPTESSINLGCARTGAVPTQVPFQCGPDCSMPFGTLHHVRELEEAKFIPSTSFELQGLVDEPVSANTFAASVLIFLFCSIVTE